MKRKSTALSLREYISYNNDYKYYQNSNNVYNIKEK